MVLLERRRGRFPNPAQPDGRRWNACRRATVWAARISTPAAVHFSDQLQRRAARGEFFSIEEGGPYWTVHLAYSQDVLVRRLYIRATEAPNMKESLSIPARTSLSKTANCKQRDDCVVLKIRHERRWLASGAINRECDYPTSAGNRRQWWCRDRQRNCQPDSKCFVHDCRWDGVTAGIRIKVPRARGGSGGGYLYSGYHHGGISPAMPFK